MNDVLHNMLCECFVLDFGVCVAVAMMYMCVNIRRPIKIEVSK